MSLSLVLPFQMAIKSHAEINQYIFPQFVNAFIYILIDLYVKSHTLRNPLELYEISLIFYQ